GAVGVGVALDAEACAVADLAAVVGARRALARGGRAAGVARAGADEAARGLGRAVRRRVAGDARAAAVADAAAVVGAGRPLTRVGRAADVARARVDEAGRGLGRAVGRGVAGDAGVARRVADLAGAAVGAGVALHAGARAVADLAAAVGAGRAL